MKLTEIIELDKKYYMNTFGDRQNVAFERGNGMYLYDTDGTKYTDFFAGIAVNCLGYSHPDFVKALKNQVEKVIHTSSLYYIENQARLAQKIAEISCADRVFFANSGAEANEGAIKLAKMYHYKKGSDKTDIITLTNSFHGRTLATLTATGQEKFHKPFYPLPSGFSYAPLNDFEALENIANEKTAAVMVELIQGEGGVINADYEYINKVYDFCNKNDIVFIVDEIQTGIGRTGKMFAYEHYGIEPDVFTLAKALGGGVPIGAVCAKENYCAFTPGDHGSTFGGNALATAAGLAVLDIIEKENLCENAALQGEYFSNKLRNFAGVKEVRGKGLMIGVELETPVKEIINNLFEEKFIVGSAGANTLRILPPLIITKNDIDEFINALTKILNQKG